jgi:DNA replication protein DnaC
MVVYRALYGEGGLWVCPAEMWNETVERDGKVASTIFCSQFSVRGWQDKIGDPILAAAICDRIVHDSYTLVVEGEESMRKRKGIPEDT